MQIPLFCSSCCSELEYCKESQRAVCPHCTRKNAKNQLSARAQTRAQNCRSTKQSASPLTETQQAIKNAERGTRRTQRFSGGHGVLKAQEIPEKVIQQRIMERLFAAGWLVVRLNSGSATTKTGSFLRAYRIFGMPPRFASSGLPDLVAFRGSRALLIEVKDRLGQLRDSQVRFIEFAARFNVTVHVMRDWQSADELTSQMLAREANRPTRADWLRLRMIEFIARRELGSRLDDMLEDELLKVEKNN